MRARPSVFPSSVHRVHVPSPLVAGRAPSCPPLGGTRFGNRPGVLSIIYIVGRMTLSIPFFARPGRGSAIALATPGGVGIAVRATRAWRNGRRNGLERFEYAAGNRGRRTAQTRGNLSTAIPSQARQREGVETRRAAPISRMSLPRTRSGVRGKVKG